MRPRLGDPDITLAMAWIWLGVLLVILVAYALHRWWRRRHPRKPAAAPLSYAEDLRQRLQKPKTARTKGKRRGKPPMQPPRPR